MSALDREVKAALKRIGAKDKNLDKELKKAVGYAVFPSVGRAGVVLGGAYGHGLVFEGEAVIGQATVGQFTVGVQVGGQSLSLVILFRTKDALERFKRGRIAFTANASADMGKAGKSGTSDFEKDVTAKAYSLGGMFIEASLGGQGFRFRPKSVLEEQAAPKQTDKEEPEKKVG